jgi:metallo-beta-lactamase class B
VTSWLVSLVLLLSVFQASTFKADPPHQCEDCPTWNKAREPFRVFGNTYYVGTDGLSALLVTGDAGHVLLDAGLPQSAPLIDASIRKLGFTTEDVKLIVISHGHFDHAGGANALQRHTGATVAASASTADAMRRGENTPDDPQYGFGRQFNGFPAVKSVKVAADQEVLTVGKTAIKVHLIPGHAPGSTAYTWQSCENGKCLNMVYADSLTSPSAPGFKYGPRLDSFMQSIEKVAALPCDIVLSPHPEFTQVDDKLKRRAEMKGSGADPFIDPNGCKAYAAAGMKRLEARRAQEAKP